MFDRAEDAKAFNEKIDAVARLQEQLNERTRKAEEALRQLPAERYGCPESNSSAFPVQVQTGAREASRTTWESSFAPPCFTIVR